MSVTVPQTYSVLPSLIGLGFDINKTPRWNTNVPESASGKTTGIGFWSYPKVKYDLNYDYLPSDNTLHDLQDLVGFFNSLNGRSIPFLYDDPDDDTITSQLLGTGNSSAVAFQLVRTEGGFTAPVYAPNVINNVYVAGVAQGSSLWSVSAYGTSAPGTLTFTSAPSSGQLVTADFTYYWACRFLTDTLTFRKFVNQIWDNKAVSFETEK